jgi:hypothetical protein
MPWKISRLAETIDRLFAALNKISFHIQQQEPLKLDRLSSILLIRVHVIIQCNNYFLSVKLSDFSAFYALMLPKTSHDTTIQKIQLGKQQACSYSKEKRTTSLQRRHDSVPASQWWNNFAARSSHKTNSKNIWDTLCTRSFQLCGNYFSKVKGAGAWSY